MTDATIDVRKIKSVSELVKRAKWLEGKTLAQVTEAIKKSDRASRVQTKGHVGYVIEKGFFGIEMNSASEPDIKILAVEVKTCPLKFNKQRDRLSVKEPLSLNIINYMEEFKNNDITESSLYKKNKDMLLVLYIHDKKKKRSQYVIKHVLLWKMDDRVLDELRPDYKIIIDMIRQGKAHMIHQKANRYLTLCPKHSGTFKDPKDKISKRKQPFSNIPAETRAFRLKSIYMNIVISRLLDKQLGKGGWSVD